MFEKNDKTGGTDCSKTYDQNKYRKLTKDGRKVLLEPHIRSLHLKRQTCSEGAGGKGLSRVL